MKRKATLPSSETDFERLDAMKDEDIDLSDIPEVPPEMFAKALVRKGLESRRNKVQLSLRLDAEVLEWFRTQGRGYQTRINQVLKAYKEAHEKAI